VQTYRHHVIGTIRFLLVASSIFLPTSAMADGKLAGAAAVISGDTIQVQGQRVRLQGVTAPGLDQLCVGALARWRCGMVARLKLGERIGSSPVLCHGEGADGHGNVLGRCRLEKDRGVELNRWVLASGWGFASGKVGQAYEEAEREAKSRGAGLWRDGFEPTDEWRRAAERAAREPGEVSVDCSSCIRATPMRSPRAPRSRADRHRGWGQIEMAMWSIRAGLMLLCLQLAGGVSVAARSGGGDVEALMARAADPAELRQVWERGWLHLPAIETPNPQPPVVGPLGSAYVRDRLKSLPGNVTWPTVVFQHGCAGIQAPERRVAGMLTRMGFAVVLPNSFARPQRPVDCVVGTGEWGLAPNVHLLRRAELVDAMSRVRALPWVDTANLFLGGFGEGARSVALWGGQEDVSGYLITGWTCSAPPGLEWLDGLRLPADRPLLAIVARDDPYYRRSARRGSCDGRATDGGAGTSLVIDGTVHNVFVYPESWLTLVEFMLAHTSSALVPSQAFRDQGLRISIGLDGDQLPMLGSPPLRSGDLIGTPLR
jgi:endonuclease YncB( thermonuclease family)/dienelactone hydrolase